jgi:hypothetical protein
MNITGKFMEDPTGFSAASVLPTRGLTFFCQINNRIWLLAKNSANKNSSYTVVANITNLTFPNISAAN